MTELVKIKIRPLEAATFARYGQMLENKQPVFPEVEPGNGRLAIELKYMTERPETKQIRQINIHPSYNQTIIPLSGAMVLLVAPPPRDPSADQETIEFDYELAAGFLISPGQAAFIEKAVWHTGFMLGPKCEYINVTRKNSGEGTTVDVGIGSELKHKLRPYIDYLDLQKRDDKILDLDFSGVQHLVGR